jgi:tetratricopeptide (TPR) repeat protein
LSTDRAWSAQQPALDEAVAAYRTGKTDDAKRIHNNAGNHYLAAGDRSRARALAMAGRCPESVNLLEKLDLSNASVQFAAGMAYADCKRYPEAETSFARETDPAAQRQGDYYLLRAQILDAQGNVQAAADALNQAIRAEPARGKIQTRWPEWDRPYLLKGILLQTRLEPAQARRALDTAIPYIYLLAGKIALARKDYDSATAHLLEATRLAPALVPAHYALRDVYNALGDQFTVHR